MACRLFLFFCGVALPWFSSCALFKRQPPEPRRAVALSERVTLGGFEQAILIRGDDARSPVLLFLHGGPGLPEMPVSHRNADLERDFIVVQWDQRGAGKSYRPGIPPDAMRLRAFVRDTLELSRQLARRFGQRRIYLVGYSFGSLVGALAAAKEPSLFHAYIGIGQLVHIPQAETALYGETLAAARAAERARAVRELEGIGPPPYETAREKKIGKGWVREFQPPLPRQMTPLRFAALAFTSPFYGPLDFARTPLGASFSYERLEDEIYAADLFKQAPRINVPVWFFMGRRDTVVSSAVLARYFRGLRAPRGKKLVWFDQSDHVPHLEEPAKYRAEMRRVLAATR